MYDLLKFQKDIIENKKNHNFNTTDLNMEFCLAHGELSEAYIAMLKKQDDVGEELADATIYILGIAELLGIDLGHEIEKKIEKNKTRIYKMNNKGVLVKEDELNENK
ncbi:MAG: hypothetical protein IK137_00715 [Bacilli bacterium]|nr:hypothetical protein [Bacilli bacterium]